MTATTLTAAYLERVSALLARIAHEEAGSISHAAAAVADRVAADRLIYVFGPGGHSAIGAQEVFFRAGGLACVSALLDDGFSLSHGARRSTSIERTPGYARAILQNSGLVDGDVLVIVNAYGVNSACIDSAVYAHELGVTTVGVTSVELQRALPSEHPARHPSKRNLCDLVDIVIDTKVPMGDAVMQLEGVPERVGPVSSFANVFAMNALMLETTNELARRGIDPPVWRSGNSPGGDEAAQALIERYESRVRKL
jgi:uncharacterized phosphosugar-binding protein